MLEENEMIEKASKLLGIPKTNIKNIFKDKTYDDAISLLYDIESTLMTRNTLKMGITQRLNLDELYDSFLYNEYIKLIRDKDNFDSIDVNDDETLSIWKTASKNSKERLFESIRKNDSFIKVNYVGKNITSKCSQLPHIPHYNKKDKTFCCGISGDIELVDYTIRITIITDKIKGNRNNRSAMKGAYKLQII